jgi:hypothetical protein
MSTKIKLIINFGHDEAGARPLGARQDSSPEPGQYDEKMM